MMLLPLALHLAAPAQASVVSVNRIPSPTSVLAYHVVVTTTEPATVALEVWEDGDAPGDGWVTDYTTTASTVNVVPLYGLEESTRYHYRVRVHSEAGGGYLHGTRLGFRTAALPGNLPSTFVTTYGGTSDLAWLAWDGITSDTGAGVILLTDPDGDIVWYHVADDPSEAYEALHYEPSERAIYVLRDHDAVVRVGLDGTESPVWTLSDVLTDLVHHEVQVYDGVVYTLVARESSDRTRTFVEDGIIGYDATGAKVFEWWTVTDGGMDTTRDEPYEWTLPGTGFWASEFPTAADWLHANSLQLRDEGGATKAYLSFRHINQIVKVDVASGAIEWRMGQNSTGSANSRGDFSMSSRGVSTTWWQLQHDAHFEDDGLLYLFDNQDGRRTDSRGLAVSVDESAMEVRIERAIDLSEFVDRSFDGYCDMQGSAYRTPGDHLVMTCGTEDLIAEYDATGSLVWSMDVGMAWSLYRATPVWDIGHN